MYWGKVVVFLSLIWLLSLSPPLNCLLGLVSDLFLILLLFPWRAFELLGVVISLQLLGLESEWNSSCLRPTSLVDGPIIKLLPSTSIPQYCILEHKHHLSLQNNLDKVYNSACVRDQSCGRHGEVWIRTWQFLFSHLLPLQYSSERSGNTKQSKKPLSTKATTDSDYIHTNQGSPLGKTLNSGCWNNC